MGIPYWSAIGVLAVSVPIQLGANVPEKTTKHSPIIWAPATVLKTQTEFVAPGFSLAHLWLLWAFEWLNHQLEDIHCSIFKQINKPF